MVVEVEVSEVDDYVRTDTGVGPIRLRLPETNDLVLSVGRMGFSATANMEISNEVVVFGLITQAPSGRVWCGTELAAGQLFAFGLLNAFGQREVDMKNSVVGLRGPSRNQAPKNPAEIRAPPHGLRWNINPMTT
jgi:hypothetical protein